MIYADDLDLDEVETRIIGCLIEKESTTPDSYPLSTNGLVTACNQKSARDPVVSFSEVMVDGALLNLRQRGMVRIVSGSGSRTKKHRHVLDEALGLPHPHLAVMGVLMLRGAQTSGELRSRTERIHKFDSTDDVEEVLHALAGREVPLTVRLPRQSGQKEARWIHLISAASPAVDGVDPAAVASPPVSSQGSSGPPTESAAEPPAAALPATVARTEAPVAASSAPQIRSASAPAPRPAATSEAPAASGAAPVAASTSDLSTEVASLRTELAELTRRFNALCDSLGEHPS